MSVHGIAQRVEICFWKALIPVLGLPAARRYFRPALFVSACLVFAFLSLPTLGRAGGLVSKGEPSQTPGSKPVPPAPLASLPRIRPTQSPEPAYPSSQPEEIIPGGEAAPARLQTNTLVVLVDNLEASSPALKGVWLVASIPNSPPLFFLPLFPHALNRYAEFDPQLQRTFSLPEDQLLAPGFEDALRSIDIWWDKTVIVDETAVDQFITLAGDLPIDSQGEESASTYFLSSGKRDQAAMRRQTRFIQAICSAPRTGAPSIDPARFELETLSQHTRTDYPLDDLIHGMQNLAAFHGPYSCEFPTLTPQAATPAVP